MITIQSYNVQKSSTMDQINRDDSMLILGKGASEYRLNELVKPLDSSDMKIMFGDSELTDAYNEAIKYGAQNIFVMNCYKTADMIDASEIIGHYNFAYITPIGINLSDTFYNSEYGIDMYFAECYLNENGVYNNSLLIFTDQHASLYEDIDSYLSDMHSKVEKFKEESNYNLNSKGRNMAFCLNNLEYTVYSNVILAALLSSSAVGAYPETISKNAIYDIDSSDIMLNEIIYFKNNIHTGTSIENLKNFRTIPDANKLIAIDKVIKHIERTLDTSFVLGKLYSSYVKMQLHDYLDLFFRKLLKESITNYCINDISFIKGENMSGYISVDIDIYPINSLEGINTLLEVR